MRVSIYWIGGLHAGRLGVMARPRGGDWLEDEVRSLMASGVDVVVSLLEAQEVAELDIAQEQALCEENGIAYLSFPISDRRVPVSKREAVNFARTLSGRLAAGQSLVIHCRQGVGRSSVIAACVMMQTGASADEAFRRIEAARGCGVPDTEEQRRWVARLAEG